MELKYLKNYLGTGLKCYGMGECTIESDGTDDEKPQLFTIEGMNSTWVEVSGRLETVTDQIHIEDCIPHLLPLSALTEQLEDGSVPIVELAKIAHCILNPEYKISFTDVAINASDNFYLFGYDFLFNSFHRYTDGESIRVKNQLQLFEYLFANHFDVWNLIDANLAIDKRTIK